ncbi:MAG: CDP-diacylglycerol--glycerol-3-phosphate 3-phosphatidyltransferase [Bacilli bacterium]|jgi:CDP-diacylglycerol--glycerol-3-phosphate 3-phosphatidyltransferase|nr:CDP-diacylglycerol--glycerol-3-phosphate 3-phosphatidyltransferase [Bacilli bacterium]MCX4254882.1 CDP-diacylglycerol--glycerol-3-phosphate 3-phosphatidyltransferase [Bacilli bacterium]
MNLPNKITMGRIILSIIILVMLVIPWYSVGVRVPTYIIGGKIVIDLKYIIAGVLFVIAALTDFLDGYIARSRNLVTDFGKVMDAIADKVLVNGLLIILAYDGFISVAIPVIIITRDIFVDSFKMASGKKGKVVAASFLGKAKTMCMMIGMALTMFYNLPFELLNLNVGYALIIVATILSVVSGCQYYNNTKDSFKEK